MTSVARRPAIAPRCWSWRCSTRPLAQRVPDAFPRSGRRPAGRLGEAELRYSIDSRWTLVGFGGGGRVADTWHDLDDASSVWAGGAGFRYLMARQPDMNSGLDFAWGPGGEFAFYIQMGSAWR